MNHKELDLKNHQIVYTKLFDNNECDEILKLYNNMTQALSYKNTINKFGKKILPLEEKIIINNDVRKSKIKYVLYDNDNSWIFNKLLHNLEKINDKYFKYDNLGIDNLNILEYDVSDKFDWHYDTSLTKPFLSRKISVVVFISDRCEYEGGQLEFMPKLKEPIKMEKGYMVVFPSHKIHRVTPIISGVRRVIATWLMED